MWVQYACARLRTYLIFHQYLDIIQSSGKNYCQVKHHCCQVSVNKLVNYETIKYIVIVFTELSK